MKLGELIKKVDSPLITETKVLNLERRHEILGSRTVREGDREYKDYPDEAIEILKKLAVSKKLGFKEKEVINRTFIKSIQGKGIVRYHSFFGKESRFSTFYARK
jgi:hypothetical protein